MIPISFSYAPSVSSVNAIALSQTPSGGGAVTLNGALASGGVATMGDQQTITITSAGADISDRTFTLVGTNKNGNAIGETLTGPGAGLTVSPVLSYYTLSSVTISGVAAGAIMIGVNGLGASKALPLDIYLSPFSVSVAVTAIVGATYKLQYTLDDVQNSAWPTSVSQVWFDHATMIGKTTTTDATINNAVTAVRFVFTSAANPESLSARIVQAGIN